MPIIIMLGFEAILTAIAVMYAATNLEDYKHKPIKHFAALFCLPFFGMQCFIWIIPAGLCYMHGFWFYCLLFIMCIVISFIIVFKIENAMAIGL